MRCSVQRGVLGAAGVHSGGGFRLDVTTMTSFVRRQTFLLGGRRPAASGNWVAKTLDKPELAYVDVKLLTFFLRLFGDVLQAGRRCGDSVAVGGRWAGAV